MTDVLPVPYRQPQFDPDVLNKQVQGEQNLLLKKIADAVRDRVNACVEEGQKQELNWWQRHRLKIVAVAALFGALVGALLSCNPDDDGDDDDDDRESGAVAFCAAVGSGVALCFVWIIDEIGKRLFNMKPLMPTDWDQARQHCEVVTRCRSAIFDAVRTFLKDAYSENTDLVKNDQWHYSPLEELNLKLGKVEKVWAKDNTSNDEDQRTYRPAAAIRVAQRYGEAIVLGNLASFARELYVFEEDKWYVEQKGSGTFVEQLLRDCLTHVGDSASRWHSRVLDYEQRNPLPQEQRAGPVALQRAHSIAVIREALHPLATHE